MFSKDKNNSAASDNNQDSAIVEQDLIVHNMPNAGAWNEQAAGSSAVAASNFGNGIDAKKNFKTVGLVIIGVGAVFIVGLAYLAYQFIIAPVIGRNEPVAIAPAVIEEISPAAELLISETPAVTATATELSTVTPTTLDLTDVASSSVDGEAAGEITMNEEFVGQGESRFPPPTDSDNDGLYDEEEEILGISGATVDFDGDGYDDLAEINNGYDPAGPGRLEANIYLAKHIDALVGYEMLYPKDWPLQSAAGGLAVIFNAPDDSLMQISVQENTDKVGILNWYQNYFPTAVVGYDDLENTDSWEGVMGEDGLNFYLTDQQRANIFVISYIPVADRFAYLNIFRLLIDSLTIK
ncbi:TPA: hypothetical protein DCZ15_01715 [Candidatus Falkowbacteria bacterium]|nr:MAG: PAP2 superfamily protein [Candidatus Falkowbacteria bacterium GW2011_GWF2_43_32]HBA36574.1 hypothetical protein [Candidatus Falkowbacteria bacterium]